MFNSFPRIHVVAKNFKTDLNAKKTVNFVSWLDHAKPIGLSKADRGKGDGRIKNLEYYKDL